MTQGNFDHPPKLIFEINVPTTFTLPFGDYKEIESQYGTSWKYAAEVAGVRHTLFADVKCHQAMLNVGIAPGVELTVTKTQESYEKDGQPRRVNTYIVEGGTGLTQAAPTPDAFAAQVAVMTAPAPAGEAIETYKLQARHFKRCIAQAEKIYTDLGYIVDKSSPESINSAAATLFIQTCKSLDLRSLSPPQAAPAPAPPPPPPPPPPQVEPAPPANNEYDDDLPF